MSLPPSFLDDIRARVPISRIVGRKVTWDLRKSNQARGDWWAPCPFHQEKSASFHCDDQKGFYYCFGCHAKGDVFGFLRDADGMEFMEAVRLLANEAGLTLPERDPAEAQRADRRATLVDATEQAVRWFRMQLSTAAAAEARDYLARRGLDAAALERFEIGFAPNDRHALFRALRDKGLEAALIVESGLAAKPDDGGEPYDRFRGRIIYPIRDGRGRAIAFGGRAMDPNARAKYLNSPETPIFDKGRNLYNLGPARAAVAKGAPLIVAEGYMDVIALVRAGFEGAVAPLGTAITDSQLQLMWRISPEPVIMLDGDAAGQRAALRLIDMALPMSGPGQALRFVTLPAGQDPDDLIRDHGAGAMAVLLAQARPLVDLLWSRETEGKVFDSPERRAALDHALRQAIAKIPDETTRNHYAQELKRKRWEMFSGGAGGGAGSGAGRGRFTPGLRNRRNEGAAPQTRASALVTGDVGDTLLEAVVLMLCARHQVLIARLESRLERLEPQDPDRAALVHDLLTATSCEAGGRALERLRADPHVSSTAIINDEDTALTIVENALDRLEARRAARQGLARAEAEIAGLADEGLTWRMSQLARARQRAEHPDMDDTSDLGEDHEALAASLKAKLDAQIWRKGGA
ncbi:MAG: DNA primase [Paracoccus sp. (in: a-proteobacteria)]|uniref:DNA primase n=1 Tax=Paracoccus sp. TaxID=267 RepID=UPI0026DF9C1C|nr:DNA primase [Paracoccus sp. (in: a-proteobacteria)]MDO5622084.1 DNA primase [Paracoccus sp. (in: a-proteobacteria)]